MVSNEDVAVAFANGESKCSSKNMFIDGDTVYSWGHHFPIAWRNKSTNTVYCTADGYSMSTTRHKNLVFSWLDAKGFSKMFVPKETLFDLARIEPEVIEQSVEPQNRAVLKRVIVEFFKGKGVSSQRVHREVNVFLERMGELELLSNI